MKNAIQFIVEDFQKHLSSYRIKVNIKEIAHKFDAWLEANLRDPDASSAAVKAARQVFINNPDDFYIRNFGIILHVHHVTYDEATKTVSIEFSDHNRHGFMVGEPMYRVICNYIDELDENTKNGQTASIGLVVFEVLTKKEQAKI